MTDENIALLEKHGWEVECESPREIRHKETGSFATLWAVDAVIESIERAEMLGEYDDASNVQNG